jgi:hypothetical protein
MSVSSISSALSTAQPGSTTSAQANPRALWAQVGGDLKSGNLAGAQQAFSSLKSLYKANHSGTVPHGPLASDISSLGKALSSGSLSAAQSAFNTLQQAAQAAGIAGSSAGSSAGAGATPTSSNRISVLA